MPPPNVWIAGAPWRSDEDHRPARVDLRGGVAYLSPVANGFYALTLMFCDVWPQDAG
jgi:hypothetical protein